MADPNPVLDHQLGQLRASTQTMRPRITSAHARETSLRERPGMSATIQGVRSWTRSFLIVAVVTAACGGTRPPPVLAQAPSDVGTVDGGDIDTSTPLDPPDASDCGCVERYSSSSDDRRPEPPPTLVRYLTGDPADNQVEPRGPGLLLMGGSTDVDAAFAWWRDLVAGGDVVVLRTSGADGYNDYLFSEIGGVDSVETLLVTSRALADDEYVVWTVAHAEGLFIAGGDQAEYLRSWKDTRLARALDEASRRGAVVGGTSAGLAVLGEFVFAAYNDTVTSAAALADPYGPLVQLDRGFLALPLLRGVITDSHFSTRDRLGRLIVFAARIISDGWAGEVVGLGVDERTALVVGPDGRGEVVGEGRVSVLRTPGRPARCVPGAPLEYEGPVIHRLGPGDTVQLPGGATNTVAIPVRATGGVTVSATPN
jgi:cyanophycinase